MLSFSKILSDAATNLDATSSFRKLAVIPADIGSVIVVAAIFGFIKESMPLEIAAEPLLLLLFCFNLVLPLVILELLLTTSLLLFAFKT